MKKWLKIFGFLSLAILVPSVLWANPQRYIIDPQNSYIKCSVHYLVVPKITGNFQDFSGVIYFDPENSAKSSVLLKVKTDSIKTGNTKWDRIITSSRVLDSATYPEMVFESEAINADGQEAQVKGLLNLHGVQKNMRFPFQISGPRVDEDGREYLVARGQWYIPRKEFGVIWHDVLDKGGVIVGNTVVVDWTIFALKE